MNLEADPGTGGLLYPPLGEVLGQSLDGLGPWSVPTGTSKNPRVRRGTPTLGSPSQGLVSSSGFAEIWARIHGSLGRIFQGGGLVPSTAVIHGGRSVGRPNPSSPASGPASSAARRRGTRGAAPECPGDVGAASRRQEPGKSDSSPWGEPGLGEDRSAPNGPGEPEVGQPEVGQPEVGLCSKATTGRSGRSGAGDFVPRVHDLPEIDLGQPERVRSGGGGSRVEGPGCDAHGDADWGVSERPRRGLTGGAPWWGAGVASRAWDEVQGADLAKLFREGARVELDRLRGTSTAVDRRHLVGRRPSWGLGQGLRQRAGELRSDLQHHGQVLLGLGGDLLEALSEALSEGRRPQGKVEGLGARIPASSWARVALALRDSSSTRLELGAALLEEGHLEACRWVLGGLLVEEVPRVIRRRAHRGRALAWERDAEWERARASWSAAAFLGDEAPREWGSGPDSGSTPGSTFAAHRRELIESREDWRACLRLARWSGDAREAQACRKELDRIAAGL